MIIITAYRKQSIIADVGYIKNILLLFGLLIYSMHFYFNSFYGYTQCILKLYMKHVGNFIFCNIFLIFLTSGRRLGLSYDTLDLLKLNVFQSDDIINSKYSNEIMNDSQNNFTENINNDNNVNDNQIGYIDCNINNNNNNKIIIIIINFLYFLQLNIRYMYSR